MVRALDLPKQKQPGECQVQSQTEGWLQVTGPRIASAALTISRRPCTPVKHIPATEGFTKHSDTFSTVENHAFIFLTQESTKTHKHEQCCKHSQITKHSTGKAHFLNLQIKWASSCPT